MKRDSIANTFLVATVLCVVCSVLVSAAAVGLRPRQQENRARERMKNILGAAGLMEVGIRIEDVFEDRMTQKIVDLRTGEFVPIESTDGKELVVLDGETYTLAEYNHIEAADNEVLSVDLSAQEDIAGLGRRENYAPVYFVDWQVSDGKPSFSQIILPVRGQGLWSTLFGFLALESDLNTIRGLTFYEHGETPGLGGEVDNPSWKAKWVGKTVFAGDFEEPVIEVIKGAVGPDTPGAEHKVDGLAGATITARGVTDLLGFWLGPDGFGPLLSNLK